MNRFLVVTNAPASAWTVGTAAILQELGTVSIATAQEITGRSLEAPYSLILVDMAEILDEAAVRLVSTLRTADDAVPILVATASPTWNRARGLLLAGAGDYIRKTTDRATLLAMVDRFKRDVPDVSLLGRADGSAGRTTMGDRHILLADNDPDYLDTCAEFLQNAGYRVHKAKSVELASDFLQTGWAHLAVFDMRLRNDEDESDHSGLDLAATAAPTMPKVILTRFPTHEAARRALSPLLSGGHKATAIDFISKLDGLESLRVVVDSTFAQHVSINWDLEIQPNERNPITFPHLATLLEPQLANDLLVSRAVELRDLFRKLFPKKAAIRLDRQLWQAGGRVALLVTAFAEKRAHETLIVVCDSHNSGRAETRRYRDYAPPAGSDTATLFSADAHTTHFAANAYTLAGNPDVAGLHSLIELHRANAERAFNAALVGLINETLPAWHQDKRILDRQSSLDAAYRSRLGLDRLPLAEFEARVEALVAQLPVLGVTARRADGTLVIGFDGQETTYLDPVAAFAQDYAGDGPVVLLTTPGRVAGETVLADEQGHAWLTDFAAAGRAPLLWNFVTLEAAARFDWIDEKNLRRRAELERWLNMGEFLPLSLAELEPSVRRAAQAIQRVRRLAVRMVAKDVRAYHLGIFYQAARRIAGFNPAFRLTPTDLAGLGHALLAVAQLGAQLAQQPGGVSAPSGIRVDKANQAVWVRDKRVPLRGQSYRLLCYLYDHAGRLCTRQNLVEQVLEERYDEQDASQKDRLNVALRRLREKIEDDPSHPRYLLTEPGGYRLVAGGE